MAVKMISEKAGDVKEKTKDWRRPLRSPPEMSRMCVECLFCSRCPADPASLVAGVTGIVKRHVYTGPNPNGFGPRGAVRLSSPVRAYVGVCNFRIVLEQ